MDPGATHVLMDEQGPGVTTHMYLFSENIEAAEVHLLDFWPEPGKHVLRLECAGRNPRSQCCYCGIESVRLRERRPRVAEWGRDKDRDWRKDPVLYR